MLSARIGSSTCLCSGSISLTEKTSTRPVRHRPPNVGLPLGSACCRVRLSSVRHGQAPMAERPVVLPPDLTRERAMVSSSREQSTQQRVTEARRIVARQRHLIAKLEGYDGYRHREAELLAAFEQSLAIFEDDLSTITADAQAPVSHALKSRAV